MKKRHNRKDGSVGIMFDYLSRDVREQRTAYPATERDDARYGADYPNGIDIVGDGRQIRLPGHVRERHDGDDQQSNSRRTARYQQTQRHKQSAGQQQDLSGVQGLPAARH